jgi:hypothetical protein
MPLEREAPNWPMDGDLGELVPAVDDRRVGISPGLGLGVEGGGLGPFEGTLTDVPPGSR